MYVSVFYLDKSGNALQEQFSRPILRKQQPKLELVPQIHNYVYPLSLIKPIVSKYNIEKETFFQLDSFPVI